jgi:5-methylcytosine-specific restriction endonuclease McrA
MYGYHRRQVNRWRQRAWPRYQRFTGQELAMIWAELISQIDQTQTNALCPRIQLAYFSNLANDPCVYCGIHYPKITRKKRNKNDRGRFMTRDHIVPARGQHCHPARSLDNLASACPRCNQAKADQPLLMYLLARSE